MAQGRIAGQVEIIAKLDDDAHGAYGR
jgi:hypothetical protein